ncbi:MAG: chaperone modulator CbpM [Saprospiraceae bacterium]|nr:chaperone modulator CbpM [Saprospiraceae bacterium]MCF8248606.1 chaperone modulator CbpM [Saprospiraceae bacterium]MCF8281044.1 chaperone modulator CbpM [Bacteroidales bacterium]MCF8310339.1 chaperone modulator CbpM [Saprospiraceae bacterium]MCF8442080.1 chaperone modulator CbpM [Saprospiraceae bacterium]
MSAAENYIEISQLCLHYEIETSFIDDLCEYGLIEISTIEQARFIHHDRICDLEKILRLQRDLDINMEGIASVLHLLQKIDRLQAELNAVHNKLQIYEGKED